MIANCRSCGKMFAKTVKDMCPDCIRSRQKTFDTIREYLKKYPAASVPEVVEALDVLLEDVVDLIEEGSLMLREFPNFSLRCDRCGNPTQEGRYCVSCKNELASQLADATSMMRTTREKNKQSRFYSQN